MAYFWGLWVPCLIFCNSVLSQRYYGCGYTDGLCSEEEECADDGLFGRCASASLGPGPPLEGLSLPELAVLRSGLAGLVESGESWASPTVQCELSYFFLTHNHDLPYEPGFCSVREPLNVLAVVQLVEEGLDQAEAEALLDALAAQSELTDLDEQRGEEELPVYDDATEEVKRAFVMPTFALQPEDEGPSRDEILQNIVEQLTADIPQENDYEYETQLPSYDMTALADYGGDNDGDAAEEGTGLLSSEDQSTLNDLLIQVLHGEKPDLSSLSDGQLNSFIQNIQLMQSILRKGSEGEELGETADSDGEVGVERRSDPDEARFVLKKDQEHLGDLDVGMAAQHKIVKGNAPEPLDLHRIQGNTVYLRLNRDMEKDQAKVLELVSFLEENIARPKNLTFSNFNIEGNEVSFQVAQAPREEQWLANILGIPDYDEDSARREKKTLPISSVAESVYKRAEDIQTLIGGDAVLEGTGIGSGPESLPVVSREGGGLVLATLVVCGLVVGLLVSLLSLFVYRNRTAAKAGIKRLAADLEGQPKKAYEELCRARMAAKGAEGGGGLASPPATIVSRPSPRNSSTSSWSEEPVPTTNMDISTGHIILSYLEEHLHKKERLAEEWAGLGAGPDGLGSSVGRLAHNAARNFSAAVVPYDVVRVKLEAADADNDYINASPIYDSDPNAPVYIATQHPTSESQALFWEMVWEQGAVLVLNLAPAAPAYHRYWPNDGAELYGIYEVHLVSEHIWCEDYVVRSFYLKNTRTTETRTVTQFHFLSWPDSRAPANPKPLLEFRRKVNKSYRGRGGSPIVIHCSDGAGRTGTYCLLDMVLNRINKGVKEMNMAGTLEHLRDQRMGMCGELEAYTFALSAVAAEVAAILHALPNH